MASRGATTPPDRSDRRVRLRLFTVAGLVAAAVLCCGRASASGLQHVTFIGDSVADGVAGDNTARAILAQGLDLDLETAPCRRVDGTGCSVDGVVPPSVVQLATTLGSRIGPYVVVSVGYNDFQDQYAGNIEKALSAFADDGVKHVWWLTLRAARHSYLPMNDDLVAAAARHPDLTLIDWNVYSRSHPEWFQADGLHLLAPGSEAMAQLVHDTLRQAGIALLSVRVLTRTLPIAHAHKPYHSQLASAGGDPPLRWSFLGAPPAGIHLLAGGKLDGTPRRRGSYTLRVQVKDAQGYVDTRILTLRVR
jgi:hypothetical protein